MTFGQSFHWTDELAVAEAVYDMLEPGGMLALIVDTVEGRPRPPSAGTPFLMRRSRRRWRSISGQAGAGLGHSPVRNHRFEDVLVRTGFGTPQSVFLPGIPNLLRDSESVLPGDFSLSWSTPHLFGERAAEFADEVRRLLVSRSPAGVFWDWPGDTEIVFARRTT